MSLIIRPARGEKDITDVRATFQAYANWLADDHDISLEFQGIDEELAGLPGKYAQPRGEILLACNDAGDVVGCVALRPFDETRAEIKRLYVPPAGRGLGVGRKLATAIIEEARRIGYAEVILDTGPFMAPAQELYRSLGFSTIEPYYHNPYPDCLFLAKDLRERV